jgi:hypothetical protein
VPRLLAEGGEGKFALIKGDEVIGMFADREEAIKLSRQKYLFQPFIVQPIHEWEPVYRQLYHRFQCPTSPTR